MKKYFLCGIALLAIAATTVFNVNLNSQNKNLSVGALANIEALASEEDGTSLSCYCALMSDSSCAVNNNGSSLCASGVNVKCWEYNRNCN
jgi:hypothetical protein